VCPILYSALWRVLQGVRSLDHLQEEVTLHGVMNSECCQGLMDAGFGDFSGGKNNSWLGQQIDSLNLGEGRGT
jgi:hypothetical protein